MKLAITQLGIIAMFSGILVPIPGLSSSPNRPEIAKYPQHPVLLVQVASY